MRYRIKQFIKGFKIFLNVALGYVLYLIPWSLLLMEKRPLSFAIMLVLTIAGLSIQYYKKEYRLVKDLKISELLNILAIGIVFVIAYLLILKLIPAKITYYNQFYYLSIYEYMSTPMYLLIASLLIPFLENFYIKSKLLKYQKNKYLTYGLIALNSIVIGFVQPYVIYGIFFGAISLMSSIYLMKTKNIVAIDFPALPDIDISIATSKNWIIASAKCENICPKNNLQKYGFFLNRKHFYLNFLNI